MVTSVALGGFNSPEKVSQSVHKKQPFSVSILPSFHALIDLTRGLYSLRLSCMLGSGEQCNGQN